MSPELGTRAGLHSQTLISTGLADLDRLLGGGLPLGAVLLLLGDAFTPHCSTLLRYFVAEGVACRHRVHWAAATTPDPASLPQLARLHLSAEVLPAARMQPLAGKQSPCNMRLKTLPSISPAWAQADQQGAEKAEDPKLRIAWQYRRYIQRQQQAPSTGSRALPPEPPFAPAPGAPHFLGGAPSRPAGAASSGAIASQPAKSGGRGGRSGVGDWCHGFDLSRPMDTAAAVQAGRLECAGYRGPDALQALVEGARAFACQHQLPATGAPAAGQPPSGHPAPPRCYSCTCSSLFSVHDLRLESACQVRMWVWSLCSNG